MVCEHQERRSIPMAPLYTACACGVVFTQRGGVKSTSIQTRFGYAITALRRAQDPIDKATTVRVHRLIASAFLPPQPSPRHQIRHLDGTRTNSAASNLAWGTPQENQEDSRRHGTMRTGFKNYQCKVTPELVRQIRAEYVRGKRGCGYHVLAKKYGIPRPTIMRLIRGLTYAEVA